MREFFYKRSDILVALLIIVIAAVVIYYRVSDIMAYPQAMKSEIIDSNRAPVTQVDTNTEDSASTDGDAVAVEEQATQPSEGESATDGAAGLEAPADPDAEAASPATLQPGQAVEFTVETGDSSVSITDKLFEAGLITDKQTFLAEVASEGAETKLMTGSFTITAGMSPAEIIQVLTAS